NSHVQFGDGITGSRLPSGKGNVIAKYRSGSGAYGELRAGSSPSAGERVDNLDKVLLPGLVSSGTAPESGDSARYAAPQRVQSLGRLVSLSDYEAEVLALSGVVRVAARWDMHEGVPSVMVRVLLEEGREGEFTDIRQQIEKARRCRGPSGYPVIVEQANFRYVYLDVEYAYHASRVESDVIAAMKAALGLNDDMETARTGLFGLYNRDLGEAEYASRIAGRLQQVEGVLWSRVTALKPFEAGIDPDSTALPAMRGYQSKVSCSVAELLQLHPSHLTLTSVAAPAEECS
ncbi:MAG: hypothetical protein JSW34_10410, partial [Candidatus Zixiibacteriota bacterium]